MIREHWLIPDEPFRTYEEYLRARGADAVALALARSAESIVEELQRSGLRGRGGAGFPAGVKWRSVAQHACTTRHVVANAAEGEPGTFKDRWLLRRNPYEVLEGLRIAAHAVGAEQIVFAIKGSFGREIERVRDAIAQTSAAGVFDDVELVVKEGPSEYLFGEEKALLEVIEGNDPLPREAHYPPYELGLFATPGSPNPALVSNVETFARVPGIVRAGWQSFRELGTVDTPGPLLFTVSGDVARPGVYEREAGLTLRALIEEVAGGACAGGVEVVLSGVSTAPLGADRLDVPCDFGSFALAGSGLGSAGFVVIGSERSIARVTQTVARFLFVESCNQCSACKLGLRTASSAIDEMFDPGLATPDDYERAVYGARSAPQGNRCYLPVSGAAVVGGLMARWRAQFEQQIEHAEQPVPEWPLPLFSDYDEQAHTFAIDTSVARKRPDWTYERDATPPPPVPRARPSQVPGGPVGVRLAPDVLAALHARANDREHLDRIVNDLLRRQLGI